MSATKIFTVDGGLPDIEFKGDEKGASMSRACTPSASPSAFVE
jgi:hypothetical protein